MFWGGARQDPVPRQVSRVDRFILRVVQQWPAAQELTWIEASNRQWIRAPIDEPGPRQDMMFLGMTVTREPYGYCRADRVPSVTRSNLFCSKPTDDGRHDLAVNRHSR